MTLRTAAILLTEIAAVLLGAELTTDLDLHQLFSQDTIHVSSPAQQALECPVEIVDGRP